MSVDDFFASDDPNFLGEYLAGLPEHEHQHSGTSETVREEYFEGHHIVVKTINEITVDGQPLKTHIGLSNDGSSYCHSLPFSDFGSLVDLVRALIREFPDDFAGEPGHGGHHHTEGG
jgi:hypothetical protein